jgi:uncharacterized membrane protein YraQ (UPF0718 family)
MRTFLVDMVSTVVASLAHNWLPLSLAVAVSAIMRVYVNGEKLRRMLLGRPHVSILASVALGALTPLCACGTTAVVIGMLTTTLPWGPIMAFLTSSPLMSPEGFILDAGILGIRFAIALTAASIVIGLASGYITSLIEKKTDFLQNQTRIREKHRAVVAAGGPGPARGCAQPHLMQAQACACSSSRPQPRFPTTLTAAASSVHWRELAEAVLSVGLRQIVLFYSLFVAIGFLIDKLVPASIIVALFSARTGFAVPLAALVGLPLYISGEGAIPLIQTLMKAGAGGGAMLAFMITGPGTSAWVVAGISTFMKRRVIALYVLYILAGGILCGYLYDLLLAVMG